MDQTAQSLSQDPDTIRVRDLHFPMVEALYVEAMVLADEARAYFETVQNAPAQFQGRAHAGTATTGAVDHRVGFACESLKTTTRLMQVISWLLFQRAIHAGELDAEFAHAKGNALGDAIPSDHAMCRQLPDAARIIIAASEQLYDRVRRLHVNRHRPRDYPPASPARAMMQHLEQVF